MRQWSSLSRHHCCSRIQRAQRWEEHVGLGAWTSHVKQWDSLQVWDGAQLLSQLLLQDLSPLLFHHQQSLAATGRRVVPRLTSQPYSLNRQQVR